MICWEATRQTASMRRPRRVCQTRTRSARLVLATGGEELVSRAMTRCASLLAEQIKDIDNAAWARYGA